MDTYSICVVRVSARASVFVCAGQEVKGGGGEERKKEKKTRRRKEANNIVIMYGQTWIGLATQLVQLAASPGFQ